MNFLPGSIGEELKSYLRFTDYAPNRKFLLLDEIEGNLGEIESLETILCKLSVELFNETGKETMFLETVPLSLFRLLKSKERPYGVSEDFAKRLIIIRSFLEGRVV